MELQTDHWNAVKALALLFHYTLNNLSKSRLNIRGFAFITQYKIHSNHAKALLHSSTEGILPHGHTGTDS